MNVNFLEHSNHSILKKFTSIKILISYDMECDTIIM